MATAKKLPSRAWRTRATKTINGKKVTKSFTVHPNECKNDSRKAKALSEMQASNWMYNTKLEEHSMNVDKAMELYHVTPITKAAHLSGFSHAYSTSVLPSE